MTDGKWRLASGGWQVTGDKLRYASETGKWWVASGGERVADFKSGWLVVVNTSVASWF